MTKLFFLYFILINKKYIIALEYQKYLIRNLTEKEKENGILKIIFLFKWINKIKK